jgi:antitoxin ParD1/3/4
VYLEGMAGRASRKVSLPHDLEDFVASKVASGRYASEGEVIREGLRLLEEQDAAEESLRASVRIGLEQALRGELLDGEEVFDSLERRIGPRNRRE